MPAVVDLFCGVGGMTHGFVKEKFRVVAGIDIDRTCKYAYEKNNDAKFIHADAENLFAKDIIHLFPKNKIKILVGCAPCQPFSKYTNRKTEDHKWRLLYSFSRLITEIQPDIISMENVPELLTYRKKTVYDDFIDVLEKNGYAICSEVVYCPDYGIPQKRTRLVLLASKFGPIKLLQKTHTLSKYKTVADTIRNLEKIEAGEVSKKDPLHRSSWLSGLNKKRIIMTPCGGSWKNWPIDLICDCHKKESGKSYGSIYGRMKWEEPSPTITTQFNGFGNGRFGHPEQNRAISFREAALLQTFPKDYDFIDPYAGFSYKTIARHIGNAVPVRLAQIIARSIKKHLEKYCEN